MFGNNTTERGQVGIGTLIVFIAMVLVAAIAAGVLINTAGMLQTQAEATGEESTDLVSERIDVTNEVGIVSDTQADPDDEEGDDRGELKKIQLGVTGAAGADDIDLNETIIQAVGPEGQENLVLADPDEGDGFDGDGDDHSAPAHEIQTGYFAVEDVDDGDFVDADEAVLNEDNGDYTIVINPKVEPFGELGDDDLEDPGDGDTDSDPSALDENDVFGEGDEATLDIVSPSGATTQVELRAPDLFTESGEAVHL
ncbi:archaellin/type IV pilin N-terminal domain-containing protein (plasmid) [Natrialbaceae archaeon A-arb3/5]